MWLCHKPWLDNQLSDCPFDRNFKREWLCLFPITKTFFLFGSYKSGYDKLAFLCLSGNSVFLVAKLMTCVIFMLDIGFCFVLLFDKQKQHKWDVCLSEIFLSRQRCLCTFWFHRGLNCAIQSTVHPRYNHCVFTFLEIFGNCFIVKIISKVYKSLFFSCILEIIPQFQS